MFFVRIQTMMKNRIHEILDRHPEVLCQAPEVSDLFGAMGMQWMLVSILLPESGDKYFGVPRIFAFCIILLLPMRDSNFFPRSVFYTPASLPSRKRTKGIQD